jgi:hypothetical protein
MMQTEPSEGYYAIVITEDQDGELMGVREVHAATEAAMASRLKRASNPACNCGGKCCAHLYTIKGGIAHYTGRKPVTP